MNMSFQVRDVRGCQLAQGECSPIALIGGRNRAGKSSIAQAIAAALTGDGAPLDGMTKGNSGQFIRSGCSSAVVKVESENGEASIVWPAATAATVGNPPTATPYAAGLASIVDLDRRERARVLSEYLKAAPTVDDLRDALADRRWPSEIVDAVWKLIEEQGWDKAHAVRKEKGAELKGEWRRVVGGGIGYGSRIAATYRPDLAELRETDLTAAVARARRDMEQAISAAAVSADEKARLIVEADALPARRDVLAEASRSVAERGKEMQVAQQHRAALPRPERQETASCPHCGADVLVERSLTEIRLLIPPRVADPAETQRRRMEIADAEGKLAHANDQMNLARRAEAMARDALDRAMQARDRLASWPAAVETGADTETARNVLARAEKHLSEYRVKIEADALHERIERNETVLDVLAPDGLRARKLTRVLGAFVESKLKPLTDAAYWQPVEIAPDMSLSLGGRAFWLLSASERYQVRTVLQLAMAQLDGSDMVVVDGADILDGPSRTGLMNMIADAGMTALVCMTLSKRAQLPDISKADLGASFWIDSGTLEPLEKSAMANVA